MRIISLDKEALIRVVKKLTLSAFCESTLFVANTLVLAALERMPSKRNLSTLANAEPESESKAETSWPVQQALGEPLPEWQTAIPTWGFAWKFYQYGFGAAFGILSLLIVIFLVRILKLNRATRPKKATLTVLILLFLFGLSRCLYLCVDAYNTKWIFPKAFSNILWSLGNPCIITAYTLIFLVLRNIFFMKERFQRWYTVRNIALMTVPYFVLIFVAELVAFYLPRFQGLTFTCQIIYALLSLMLSVFYSFIAYLLWKNKKGKNIHRGKENSQHLAWTPSNKNSLRNRRTLSVLKTCIAAVIGGLIICALQIYSMSSVYGVLSSASYVKAWPWLIFNYAMRVLELFLSLVLYVASTTGARRASGGLQTSFSVSLECVEDKQGTRCRRVTRIMSLTCAPPNAVADAVSSKGSTAI